MFTGKCQPVSFSKSMGDLHRLDIPYRSNTADKRKKSSADGANSDWPYKCSQPNVRTDSGSGGKADHG